MRGCGRNGRRALRGSADGEAANVGGSRFLIADGIRPDSKAARESAAHKRRTAAGKIHRKAPQETALCPSKPINPLGNDEKLDNAFCNPPCLRHAQASLEGPPSPSHKLRRTLVFIFEQVRSLLGQLTRTSHFPAAPTALATFPRI